MERARTRMSPVRGRLAEETSSPLIICDETENYTGSRTSVRRIKKKKLCPAQNVRRSLFLSFERTIKFRVADFVRAPKAFSVVVLVIGRSFDKAAASRRIAYYPLNLLKFF